MLISIIFVSTVLALSKAQVLSSPSVDPVDSECTDESDLYQSTYNAPARIVPAPNVDLNIKRGFLEMFRREYNPGHSHSSAQASQTVESLCTPNSVDQEKIEEINELLPRDDTFLSFADRHLQAINLLTEIFNNATTPAELLTVAREQLNRHAVNQKIWYYTLVSQILTRPELAGIILPWPIDATPDLYVTHSILRLAREGSTRPKRVRSVRNCTTGTGIFYQDITFVPSSTAPDDASGASAAVQQLLQRVTNNREKRQIGNQRDPCSNGTGIVEATFLSSYAYVEREERGRGLGNDNSSQNYSGQIPPRQPNYNSPQNYSGKIHPRQPNYNSPQNYNIDSQVYHRQPKYNSQDDYNSQVYHSQHDYNSHVYHPQPSYNSQDDYNSPVYHSQPSYNSQHDYNSHVYHPQPSYNSQDDYNSPVYHSQPSYNSQHDYNSHVYHPQPSYNSQDDYNSPVYHSQPSYNSQDDYNSPVYHSQPSYNSQDDYYNSHVYHPQPNYKYNLHPANQANGVWEKHSHRPINHGHRSYHRPSPNFKYNPLRKFWNFFSSRMKRSPNSAGAIGTTGNLRNGTENCLLYNGTRGANDAENRLWYFREDMLLNQHHWYYHQYFPKDGPSVTRVDRRGEVFFFAHHSIVARYNAERLSNGLPLETPLEFKRDANIGQGFNPDMIDENTGRFWTPRPENMTLSDINQESDRNFQFNVKIDDVSDSLNTLIQHIGQGYLVANRSEIGPFNMNIKNQAGLSHLGNTVEESPRLSLNRDLYQSAHSLGHLAISVATDPDFRCKILKGIMADVAVAMRDPAFYRVHNLVDSLYSRYQSTLPPYQLSGGEWPLQWDGVRLRDLEVITEKRQAVNNVQTFWSIRRFPLEEGIDGSIHEGEVKAEICHQHLNHEPFMFKLTIDVLSCVKSVSSMGTVRIFMAPRFDLNGKRFTMEAQRLLMFQLDAFPVKLRRGRNTITRLSKDSSATKPWSKTLTELFAELNSGNRAEYCGCGWPRHLAIPKGREGDGMDFDLFAMVTNFDEDQVLDSLEDLLIEESCISSYIYCGRPFRKYPDARPMGYPFDKGSYMIYESKKDWSYGGYSEQMRVARPPQDLEEYVSHVPNMKTTILRIQHMDRVIT